LFSLLFFRAVEGAAAQTVVHHLPQGDDSKPDAVLMPEARKKMGEE